jgi:hypothetical protein
MTERPPLMLNIMLPFMYFPKKAEVLLILYPIAFHHCPIQARTRAWLAGTEENKLCSISSSNVLVTRNAYVRQFFLP